jgi:hypothetical protein
MERTSYLPRIHAPARRSFSAGGDERGLFLTAKGAKDAKITETTFSYFISAHFAFSAVKNSNIHFSSCAS